MAQDHKISTFGLLLCATILTFGIVYLFSQQSILYYHYFKLKSVSYEDQELNGNIVLETYNTWFRKRIEINQKRIKTFKEVCQKYEPEIKNDNLTGSRIHYVYSNKLNVIGCTIPKAGSSTLQRFSEAVIFGKLTKVFNVTKIL